MAMLLLLSSRCDCSDPTSVVCCRQLCSFAHPDLAEVPDDIPQQYRGIKALKEALRTHLQRYFCDVCLEGRKVTNNIASDPCHLLP